MLIDCADEAKTPGVLALGSRNWNLELGTRGGRDSFDKLK